MQEVKGGKGKCWEKKDREEIAAKEEGIDRSSNCRK